MIEKLICAVIISSACLGMDKSGTDSFNAQRSAIWEEAKLSDVRDGLDKMKKPQGLTLVEHCEDLQRKVEKLTKELETLKDKYVQNNSTVNSLVKRQQMEDDITIRSHITIKRYLFLFSGLALPYLLYKARAHFIKSKRTAE